jgi:hypothetical protein
VGTSDGAEPASVAEIGVMRPPKTSSNDILCLPRATPFLANAMAACRGAVAEGKTGGGLAWGRDGGAARRSTYGRRIAVVSGGEIVRQACNVSADGM